MDFSIQTSRVISGQPAHDGLRHAHPELDPIRFLVSSVCESAEMDMWHAEVTLGSNTSVKTAAAHGEEAALRNAENELVKRLLMALSGPA